MVSTLTAIGAAAPAEGDAELDALPLRDAAKALVRCAWHTCVLVAQARIHQPREHVGRRIFFADDTSATIYRETVIERPLSGSPAVLVVGFRLRRVHSVWAHALFRLESELNTVLFAGFPGLVSKLWLGHDQHHLYRGFYQWDDPELAVAYVRALWWVLALVSQPGSIHYAVLPGLDRDEVLANPDIIDRAVDSAPGGWWRPRTSAPGP